MKAFFSSVILLGTFLVTQSIYAQDKLDGAAGECVLSQNFLSARFFFLDSNANAGFNTKYIMTETSDLNDIQKNELLNNCKTLLKLADRKKIVQLKEGFNYEGPGPIISFIFNEKEYPLVVEN